MVIFCAKGVPGAAVVSAAERVFSMLNRSFGDQQQNSLEDYVEATIMLQYNKR